MAPASFFAFNSDSRSSGKSNKSMRYVNNASARVTLVQICVIDFILITDYFV
jgi:hypothetical protein